MPNPIGNPQNLRQFKSGWQHLPTRQIRVPEALSEQVLELAKKLDAGQPITNGLTNNLENAIKAVQSDPSVTRDGRDGGAVKRALSALRMALQETNHNDH
jgi:coenzyme F420-reducing hydrogenase beta subunit